MYAWQIAGMAKRGFVPKLFQTRSRFGTPIYGIILGFMFIMTMSTFNFTTLIEMVNFNYSISLLMEYAAFIKLRISKPDDPRPYRVPFQTTFGCILFITPGCIMIVLLLFMASYTTYLYFILFCFIGVVFYHVQEIGKRRQWFQFNEIKDGGGRAEFELADSILSDLRLDASITEGELGDFC